MYHPKVETQRKIHQSKIELQERINKREREREREREQSPFWEESARQIIKLYKRRWVEEYSKENV